MKATTLTLLFLAILLTSLAFHDMVISFVSMGQHNFELPANIAFLQVRAIAVVMISLILGTVSLVHLLWKRNTPKTQ